NLDSLTTAPYGTWFGSFQWNSGTSLLGFGDFDGDGRKDLLMRNLWGIGLIRLTSGGALDSLNAHAFGAWLGGWHLGGDNGFLIGDINGDGRDDIVVRSPWGLGILYRTAGGALSDLDMVPNGDWIGWWHLGSDNSIYGVADVDGDGRAEIIMRSPWGWGLLTR